MGGVEKAKGGDFSQRITVLSNDEIGVLGDAGNDMIRGAAVRLSYALLGDTVNLASGIQELTKTLHSAFFSIPSPHGVLLLCLLKIASLEHLPSTGQHKN